MSNCTLHHPTAKSGKFLRLSLVDTGIVEALSNDSLFKNRKTKAYPTTIIGANGLGYLGRMALERMSSGWSLQQEDEEVSRDRFSLAVGFRDSKRLNLVSRLLVEDKQRAAFEEGNSVMSKGVLMSCSKSPDKTVVTCMFVGSTLNKDQATVLSVADKCGDESTTLSNFLGDFATPRELFKPLRNFETLGDDLLDQFESIGVCLRTTDYRHLANAQSAYVGF